MNLAHYRNSFIKCLGLRRRLSRNTIFARLLAVSFLLVGGGDALAAFPYELQWKYLVPGAVQSVVVNGDSLAFIGSAEGRVVAVRHRDGERIWLRRDIGPVYRAPVLQKGALFVADTWGQVSAFTAATGELRWQFRRLGGGDCALLAADSLLYASAADGWLYALDSASGQERWRTRLGLRGELALQVWGGRIYASAGGRLVVLEAGSGQRLGEIALKALVVARPLVDERGIFLATGDGYVRAYGVGDLQLQWSLRLGAKVREVLVFAGGHLVCVADNGFLYGINGKGGALVWRVPLSGSALGGVVLGTRGEIFVGSQDGWVIAVEPKRGEVLWRAQIGTGEGVRLAAYRNGLWAAADDDYVYAFSEPQRVSDNGALLWDMWWEVLVYGEKTGYRRQLARQSDGGGWRIEEEVVDWRGGFRRSSNWLQTDTEYRPLALREKRLEGNQIVEVDARWHEAYLRVQRSVAGYALTDTIAVEVGAVLPSVALLKLAREGRIRPGRRDSLRVVDLAMGNHRWLYVAFGEETEIAKEKAIEVSLAYDGNPLRDMDLVFWVDEWGRSVRAEQPLLRVAERRVDAQQARSWAAPAVGRDLLLNRSIDDPASVDWLVLQLPVAVGDPRPLLIEDDWQRVYRDSSGRWLLRVERRLYGDSEREKLPIDDAVLKPYLASSLYIQADDPRVRELALTLRGDERDPWQIAMRLRQWVYDHMVPRNTNIRFKSTLEVLQDMEGTCSEYTALYMALCRAAGVPVRACVGWVISTNGHLVLHIWSQVYVGRWIDVDPSRPGEEIGATHIKTGEGLLTAAGLRHLGSPLGLWMALADTFNVVEYGRADAYFSEEAAALYEEAEAADRNFEEARALELFHQVDLLPWNDRSGAALVKIANNRLRRGEFDDAQWALDRLLRMEPQGDAADDGLFYLGRIAEARGDSARALEYWRRLVRDFSDSDFADDALGQLATRQQKSGGCLAALPYYKQLREQYSRSGWASVAESALQRCAGSATDAD